MASSAHPPPRLPSPTSTAKPTTTTAPTTGSSTKSHPTATFAFRGPVVELSSSGSDVDVRDDGGNGDDDDEGELRDGEVDINSNARVLERPGTNSTLGSIPRPMPTPPSPLRTTKMGKTATTSTTPPRLSASRMASHDVDGGQPLHSGESTFSRPRIPQPQHQGGSQQPDVIPSFRIVGHPEFEDASGPKPEHHDAAPHPFGPRLPVPLPHHPRVRRHDSNDNDTSLARGVIPADVNRTSDDSGDSRRTTTTDEERLWKEEGEDLYRAIQGHLGSDRAVEDDLNESSEDSDGRVLKVPGAFKDSTTSLEATPRPAPGFPSPQPPSTYGYGSHDSEYESLFYRKSVPSFAQASQGPPLVLPRPAYEGGPGGGGGFLSRPPLEEKPSTETFFTVPSGSENRDSTHFFNLRDSRIEDEDEEEAQNAVAEEESEDETLKLTQPEASPSMPEPTSAQHPHGHSTSIPQPQKQSTLPTPSFLQAPQSSSASEYKGGIPEASPSIPKPLVSQPPHRYPAPSGNQTTASSNTNPPAAMSMPNYSRPNKSSYKPNTGAAVSSSSAATPPSKPCSHPHSPPLPALPSQAQQQQSQSQVPTPTSLAPAPVPAPARPLESNAGKLSSKPVGSSVSSAPAHVQATKPSNALSASGNSTSNTNTKLSINTNPSLNNSTNLNSNSTNKPTFTSTNANITHINASAKPSRPKPELSTSKPTSSSAVSASKPPPPPISHQHDAEHGHRPPAAGSSSNNAHNATKKEEEGSHQSPPKHNGTRYVNMLLALDDIPNYWNLLASFFTWFLLAGFLLFPGTFTSWQQEQAAQVDGAPAVTDEVKKAVLGAVSRVPLFVVAFVCSGIGAAGMIWLWWRWSANYVWLLSKIFIPGLLNALAGLLSTIANIYGAQHGEFSTTAKVTTIVTGATCVITGSIVGFYQFWLLRRVQNEHFREIGGRIAKGRHGEGVLKGMVESRRQVKEGARRR